LSDEPFARLQLADDPDEFLTGHAEEYAGKKLFLDLPRALIEGHPAPSGPEGRGVRRSESSLRAPGAWGRHTGGSAATGATCRALCPRSV
jgi:hypothetical protein